MLFFLSVFSKKHSFAAEKVKGTDWLEVVCDDGKKYYYNSASGETNWQMPPEVEAKLKVRVSPWETCELVPELFVSARAAISYHYLCKNVPRRESRARNAGSNSIKS